MPAAYFQPVPLREIRHPSGQLVIERRAGETAQVNTFTSGIDCVFPERAPGTITAPVVFAGYGIRETAPARDDYRNLDAKGKIVAILAGVPPGAEWQTPALVSRYAAASARQRFAAKLALAASLGARAVLAIETAESADRLVADLSPAVAPTFAAAPAPTFFLPFEDEGTRTPPVIRLSPRAGDAILAAADLTTTSARTAAPRDAPGLVATVRFAGEQRLVLTRNVVGVIRGADPRVRDEAVVIGAHMDHLGRSGERLHPGADDNASGVAALLEIARAFAASPSKPRRTVVFAFWTGEEEGHLGAEYYVRHPLWPLERTSVYLNLDMIGHPWTAEEIRKLVADTKLPQGDALLTRVKPGDFIELGVPQRPAHLAPALARAARGTGLALHFDWTDGKSGGSDYREFARLELPFVRFFGNYFDGYHEPTDTPDKVDPAQVLKMARLAFASAYLLADR